MSKSFNGNGMNLGLYVRDFNVNFFRVHSEHANVALPHVQIQLTPVNRQRKGGKIYYLAIEDGGTSRSGKPQPANAKHYRSNFRIP